ncbi:SDR family oxidoreductase [Sciscionella sediminilitoris]|uniref:SDR family oxidoreductase n=1 Tax=Sciscionella sediminilitoris TaxID=1445613 RepID=UPI0004DF9A87|nr:SDR family oxidoreductase [Sciscionella sp. SE31]
MSLWRSRVLVTGAARGIGAATARELDARGARLALLDADTPALRELGAELGERHVVMPGDVTESTAVRLAVDAAAEKWGGLDAVVANAGIASWGTAAELDPEAFARTVEVNLTGVFRTVHAALPHILESRGYLLLVSSLAAMLPVPAGSAYAASKAGVEALANSIRLELAGRGVAVGSAHMGVVDTDMVAEATAAMPVFGSVQRLLPWPLNGTTSPEDCARHFVTGIDRRSRRIYVPRAGALANPLRPLLGSALLDWTVTNFGSGMLAEAEAQLARFGSALSERISSLSPDS